MGSPHRSPSTRSGLVLDTHDLGRGPGSLRAVRTVAAAPADLGTPLIGVPPGSDVQLDLRLEAAGEGVLVTGTAEVALAAECGRCLEPYAGGLEIDVQELFVYPESDVPDDETPRVVGERVDLEPVLRDAVVLDLPFQPLCRPDCRGLCPTCGTNLNARPEHTHAAGADPRWAGLAGWAADTETYDDPKQTEREVI